MEVLVKTEQDGCLVGFFADPNHGRGAQLSEQSPNPSDLCCVESDIELGPIRKRALNHDRVAEVISGLAAVVVDANRSAIKGRPELLDSSNDKVPGRSHFWSSINGHDDAG